MIHLIPGSRGGGSGLPGCHQLNKVTITQSPPNRYGHMLMGKTNNTVHPGYASYLSGTETAKVEGLWLVKTQMLVSKHPDNSNSSSHTAKVQLCSPFIVPSLCCMIEPHDINYMMSQLSDPLF